MHHFNGKTVVYISRLRFRPAIALCIRSMPDTIKFHEFPKGVPGCSLSVPDQHDFMRELVGVKNRFYDLRLKLLRHLSGKDEFDQQDREEYLGVVAEMNVKRQEQPELYTATSYTT